MGKAYPYQIGTTEEYWEAYERSVKDPEGFWGAVAAHFEWRERWTKVLEWNFEAPKVEWFVDGKVNITENCIDRHLGADRDKVAMIWEANSPSEKGETITYGELHERVCLMAEVLRRNGVKKGDRVCIYMGMIPSLAVAMLACARLGAIHSVIFGGFSAHSIADRAKDAGARFIITADAARRGNKDVPLKAMVDTALQQEGTTVERVIVVRHTGTAVEMTEGRDAWYDEEVKKIEGKDYLERAAEQMDAEDPLFILYTSGSTGKPKGVVHTTGGYMVWAAYTFVNVFQYQPGEVFFCTADIGWITGHSYVVYGPLLAGATTLMYEGIPSYPDSGRLWEIVDKYGANILYTAPTAIRSLMAAGTGQFEGKNLGSLRVLGTVGEPINEEAWHWYDEHVGKGRCPIVDTWWQTETGGVMISNLAGVTPAVPAHATLPLPGVQPLLMDEQGKELVGNGVSGNLCIRFPWPGMIRTTYGDHERCRQAYFSTYKGLYFTGDGCLRDQEGNYRITGRVDDVLNVSGHRIGTAEVENAINEHPKVIESAIVGYPHDIKGTGIYAYVITESDTEGNDQLRKEIGETVTQSIGAIVRPDKIHFVTGLPKTRSGKIMRRILRKIAEGDVDNLGDVSALLDPGVVEEIKMTRMD